MKLRYVNSKDVKNDNRDAVHLHLEICNRDGKSSHIDSSTNVVHITINKEFLFLDTIACAKKVASFDRHKVYIHLLEIPYKYKLYILQIIAKYTYTFHKYKSVKQEAKAMYVVDLESNKAVVTKMLSKVEMVYFARDIANEPANIMTPAVFADYVRKTFGGKKYQHMKVKVLTDMECKEKGLNLIHEMGKASSNKSRFVIATYDPPTFHKTFCLLGKGVTFDAGGLNIKINDNMSFEMKTDKYGACIVTSLLKYVAEHKLPCKVIALIPLIENLNSGNVIHPGDILECYNKKTIEVINTDAEGRLILADALAYSENYIGEVDYMFDFATLTGWTDFLHCDHSASFFTTNKSLSEIICTIGEDIGERVIGLPRWPEYKRYTVSEVADYKNLGFTECSKPGGFMASVFLYNFVPDKLKNKWVHFDVSNSTTNHCCNGNCALLGISLLERLLSKA